MEDVKYQILYEYFQKALTENTKTPQFFIIEGIQHIDKQAEIIQLINKILGNYSTSDFLWIQDYSSQLGKQHVIKVETTTNSTNYKTLYEQYRDIGVRDINTWLQQSSFSGKKILLIENIERMTNSAINAFLKTAEEPMTGKLIIATTKNKSLLLDTVLSRALVFSVSEQCSREIIFKKMEEQTFFVEHPELKETLWCIGLGIRHRITTFAKFLQEHTEAYPHIKDIDTFSSTSKNLHIKHTLLKQLADEGLIIPFVEGLCAWHVEHAQREIANKRLKVRKLLTGNVNISQILTYALVQLDT